MSSSSHAGLDPGWHPQPPPAPPGGPQNYEEVARAFQTIQEAYPFLAQSVAYHQQGFPPDLNRLPPTAPPQLPSQLPWQPNQPPTSHGMAMPQQTPDFGLLYPPNSGYPPAGHPFPEQALLTPMDSATGESSFQTFPSTPEGAVDAEASAEEKRRRNTAASARFRVKKKLRAFNLERTVTDLTGRVGELEQEAADLRRENGWLKEIVMLKSSRASGGDALAGPSRPSGSRHSKAKDNAEEGQSTSDEGRGSDAA